MQYLLTICISETIKILVLAQEATSEDVWMTGDDVGFQFYEVEIVMGVITQGFCATVEGCPTIFDVAEAKKLYTLSRCTLAHV